MAHLFRLIAIGLAAIAIALVALLPLAAHAAFTAPGAVKFRLASAGYPTLYDSAVQACQAGIASIPSYIYVDVQGAQCRFRSSPGATIGVFDNIIQQTVYTCPINSTASGSGASTQCTCNATYDQVGSTCVNPAQALCSALAGTDTYAQTPGNVAPGASVCNATGCATSYAGTVIRVTNAQGVAVTEGSATFSGSTCNYSAETGSVTDSCPGGAQGTVNGISTCVPYDPTLNTIESEKGTNTESSDSSGTTTTGKVTNTVCNAVGSCTTTTTTTTSVNGGAPTTTTETKEEPRDDFCTSNPNSPQCKDSSFAGSCVGGFTCSGDAIQCAAARQVHETNCLLNKTTDQEALFNSNRSNDTNPLTVNATSRSISSSDFSSSNSLGMSAGVADLSISVMGQSIVLPLSNLNQYLAQLRLVLLACSWFIAYRIVSGSVRE